MAQLVVTNPKSGSFEYVGSQRKIKIDAFATKQAVEVPDEQLEKWQAQFTKDGLIAEQQPQKSTLIETKPETETKGSSTATKTSSSSSGSGSTASDSTSKKK